MKKTFEGFRTWNTGGGCTAFGRTLADGRYVLITQAEDAVAPNEQTTEFTVGLYDKGGNQIDYWDNLTHEKAIERIAELTKGEK